LSKSAHTLAARKLSDADSQNSSNLPLAALDHSRISPINGVEYKHDMSSTLQMPAVSAIQNRYEALFRVSEAISAHRNPQSLFDALANELRGVVQFDGLAVAQYDDCTKLTHWHVSHRCSQSTEPPPPDCSAEETLPCWIVQHQQTLTIPSVEHETRFPSLIRELKNCGIQSLCAFPLTTVHRKIGALLIGSEHPNAYAEEEVAFLSLVANQIAVAVDDALNFERSRVVQAELQHNNERLKLLLDLNNHVVSNLELRDILRAISASVREVMKCDGVGISLPDAAGLLRLYAIDFPSGKGFVHEALITPKESPPAKVFGTKQPLTLDRRDLARLDPPDSIANAEGIQALCCLPLLKGSKALGVFTVGRIDDLPFTNDDVEFLMQIACQVAIAVDNALAYGQIADLKEKLAQEKLYLEDEIRSTMNFAEIVGVSAALRNVLQQVEIVSATDSIVLITGETGTGKELIARGIHNHGRRKDRAFIKLNCAAIPTGLLESELFGHEKGAFTGAIAQRIGRFELANEGTVFLDEVGEIPLDLQPKLLRVLQEQEFERLGSGRTLRTDARLIAATNRDLSAMVAEQRFRADLFYRLNVFPIHAPPLRHRREDIPLLVRHFAEQFSRRMSKSIDTIPSDTMERLAAYHWPGNIRELQNIIERAVILSAGPVLKVPIDDLKENNASVVQSKSDTLEEAERKHITAALQATNWVVSGPSGAATRLGMHRATLQFRMKKLGISRPRN
jgi:formate hydrogenlyase transcriptional activator